MSTAMPNLHGSAPQPALYYIMLNGTPRFGCDFSHYTTSAGCERVG